MRNKNRALLLFLLFLISINCKSQEIIRIDIAFVDIEIETPFQITCNNFEAFFKDDIKNVSISDKNYINEFINEFHNLKKADLTLYSPPDTRYKLKIVYKDRVLDLCLDRFVVLKNDEVYVLSDSIKLLLKKYTL